MADTSNGLIYGLALMKFDDKEIGWIDENGLQPAGNAPQFLDIYAAQVTDGPVDSIAQNPGSEAFTGNLIQLNAAALVDVFGGEAGSTNSEWTPPQAISKTGQVDIKAHSGHTIRIYAARVSRNGMQNGLNTQNVLAFGFRIDMMKPADGETPRYRIYPPGVDPDTAESA